MARILIGWEFGANRGHARKMIELAEALRAHGHEVAFAVQRIDVLSPGEAAGSPVWQAPVSPRLLITAGRRQQGPPASMADILARLGMDDPAVTAAIVRGWRQLFEAARPDLIVAEFAPFLLLAARGEVPAIAVGSGFSLPPSRMEAFPLIIQAQSVDQAWLMEQVNAGLREAGTKPLESLPQVFAADRSIAATFTELDFYAGQREGEPASPIEPGFEAMAGGGEEVFVYAPETIAPDSPLWRGLASAGLRTRVHVPRAPAEMRESLAGLGLIFEPEPLPFAAIAERSRLLVSHGGHGFLSSGLAAGLPHVVCHYDLEKLTYGLALALAGLGGHVSLRAIEPGAFAASLVQIHRDDALAARARAAAEGFRSRGQVPYAQATAEAAAELV